MGNDQYLLSSVSNALAVLDLLSEYEELSLAEISKMLPFGKASIYKILYTLKENDYILKSEKAKYRLSYKFVRYGNLVVSNSDSLTIAKPHLRRLCDNLTETVHMARLMNNYGIVFIWKELSKATIQMASRIGVVLPGYCTAVGKAMLANLPADKLEAALNNMELQRKTPYTITTREELRKELELTRNRRYAIDGEESEIGLTCFAAVIKGVGGKVLAAISVSGPSERMRANKDNIIPAVIGCAEEISVELGCSEY